MGGRLGGGRWASWLGGRTTIQGRNNGKQNVGDLQQQIMASAAEMESEEKEEKDVWNGKSEE